VTAPAPATSPGVCATTADREVPHPDLTREDRAAIGAAVRRYTMATGASLAGIAAGTALAAVIPIAGAALLLVAFLTGVVVFARRLDLTHPGPGSRLDGRPLILRVDPVAAAAYNRWLDRDGGAAAREAGEAGEVERAEEIGATLKQLAELISAGRGVSDAAHTLSRRVVALVDGARTGGGRGGVARG
jgi:hypothetical protein